MLNIESKVWRIVGYNGIHINIIQKASSSLRVVSRSALPSSDELAAVPERRFDALCRNAFHGGSHATVF